MGEELPPRTRRILHRFHPSRIMAGTTSAHAENTRIPACLLARKWNYLRARGEYQRQPQHSSQYAELPPRTRRIPPRSLIICFLVGTTSAHAENTLKPISPKVKFWNYLRARGEYDAMLALAKGGLELPPRTRRIRPPKHGPPWPRGTTSAHAENTIPAVVNIISFGNYLRARGEYPGGPFGGGQNMELPPRTRRIP